MKNHDTFIGHSGVHICEKCKREIQTIWGSSEWHKENDPISGYCNCTDNPLREMVEAARKHMQHEEAQSTITVPQAQLTEMSEKYEQCHSELLAIHEIACCGWANVLQRPITQNDTLTVRDVKIMAMELLKLQAKLAERDKEIARLDAGWHEANVEVLGLKRQVLEQQARIIKDGDAYWKAREHFVNRIEQLSSKDSSALESALKAERLAGQIEGLEEAAERVKSIGKTGYGPFYNELRIMAAELKEGK